MNIKNLLEQKGNNCITISPENSMAEAVDKMMEHYIGSLIVLKNDEPIGIVTERDVMYTIHHHGCDIRSTTVGEIMGKELVFCDLSFTLKEAMTLMFNNQTGRRIRHLPVIDEGQLIGMVSNGDLLQRLNEEAEFENRVMKNYIQNWPEEDIS